ncbi:diguanylate cyclase domain-containing protein [Piscinibacter sp.]|uniref:GGDEF domain-containing protein n=1 Tax=Piscinibacter sp. TaxID=1903157 RepID=UPI0039E382FE
MNLLKRLTLRQWLTLPYVALVLGIAVLIGALSYSAGSHAVDTVAEHLLLETVGRIGQAVDRHVVGSAAVLEAAFPNGMAAPERIETELDALRMRFWIATTLHIDPNNYVYYGSRQGQFFGLWRDSLSEAELRLRLDAGEARRIMRFTGIHGALGEAKREERIFEPRERPWYKAGESSPHSTWTAIYIDFRNADLVATRARRVLDAAGGLQGVVATDISLRRLNDFVRGLTLSENAVAFIVEPDGMLIASSRSANMRADDRNERISAAASGHPLQEAAYAAVSAALRADADNGVLPRTLRIEGPHGEPVHLAYSRLRDDAGLDWITVVAVPRADFMGDVTRNVAGTALIGLAAAALAIMIGLTILGWIGRDLKRVADAARRIGEGQLDVPLEVRRSDEIGALAASFKWMQQRLRVDQLTGLVNREVVVGGITERIAHHRRAGDERPFAVLFIDLDHFKQVNDRFGHEVGDQVLVEVGLRLRRATRETDLVARYAGDEFVVLLDNVADAEAAERVRDGVERALAETAGLPEQVSGRLGSVGLAVYPRDGHSAADLIRAADHDMYARKREGRRG